jgi:beta-mannosidase
MSKNNTQALDEGWVFQCDGESDWLNATVPGCVHLDLLNNELIPDPYFGLNEQKLQWVSKKNWNYRLHFTPEKELQQKKNKRLCFYGIDTYATVYLNGKKIISANNMFHPWEVDVTDIIEPGRNELNVKLRSPINEILPHLESMNYKLPAENDQASGTSPYTRKAPYHYGWDWGPCFVTSGISQEVELFGWNSWFIKNIFIRQEKCDKDRADLTLKVF